MLGSHLDTVVNGGRFDGLAGVVSALETARVIVEDGIAHRLPLDVVVFAEEEGARFGRGLLGSSVWTGAIDRARLQEIKDDDGVSYLEAMALAGLTVDDQDRLEPANLRAMLEVHIEQGATLEKKGKRIGLVEAIVGINQFEVTIEGMANHAGTTAMAHRLDALQGAVRIIAAVEDIALRTAASGAGHDTAVMAGLTESAMIFLPSKDGRSHCPEEFTSPEDIKLGCELLLATAIELST
jgi:allantoate deiminase